MGLNGIALYCDNSLYFKIIKEQCLKSVTTPFPNFFLQSSKSIHKISLNFNIVVNTLILIFHNFCLLIRIPK